MITQCHNRCYVLTPPGSGPIGVIRLEGPDALRIMGQVFRPISGPSLSETGVDRLRYGSFVDGAEQVDDVISASIEVGIEPAVEITAHGGVRVIERILQTLDRNGAPVDHAIPKASSIWNAPNAIEAEALDALPRAKTERAVRFLGWQRQYLPSALGQIAGQCRSSPEAGRERLESMLARFDQASRLIDGATVVLLGPPNSGKSTLFNHLVGRSAVVVSPRAGTTRDWVTETIEVAGAPVTLVDTAGQWETPDLLQRRAVAAARSMGKTADLCLLVFDGSKPAITEMGSFRDVTGSFRRHLILANKLDLGLAWDESIAQANLGRPAERLTTVSAVKGTGLEQLLQQIVSMLDLGPQLDTQPCLFTERQVRLATEVLRRLAGHPAGAAAVVERQLIGTRTGDV